ncbi:related to hydrolase [Rhynchosporium agropyri]|uniref:Related to hydrolase n=2 Tax=Rhynchosporium TaxID=38037 RepID=A0A1E1JZX0_9HELO|nr:related to hydrolase [Rhynchosporium agropyri]CZT03292.1 related to hydrolase [Rhynchosporium commune]
MILGQISWLDCFVFLLFLAPQLIIHIGFFPTLFCGIKALPFLFIRLPLKFLYERYLLAKASQPPFVQQASWFEDIVIRCVRYAFASIPADIGKVFFSKGAATPFLRWRMLRHGFVKKPVHWEEIERKDFEGVWIIKDKMKVPDVVVYYAHGGGFSMGTSRFYLEFLLAFHSLLSPKFSNPAILALEYTLVPQASFPTQLHQAIAGYKFLLSKTHDPSRLVFSGDSAGGTLILSLLLHIGNSFSKSKNGGKIRAVHDGGNDIQGVTPALAVLISPWTTLISPKDKNTKSDFLDANNLHHYARQYIGSQNSPDDPLISPGNCKDASWWRRAGPSKGMFVIWGKEEVFAPEIRDWVALLESADVSVEQREEEGGIHAWPVACMFLSSTREERIKGLVRIVRFIGERIEANKEGGDLIEVDEKDLADL